MIDFKPVIRLDQIREKDKKCNIKIRVSNLRRVGYLATEFYIFPGTEKHSALDDQGYLRPIYVSKDEANKVNMRLRELIGNYSVRVTRAGEKVNQYTMPMLLKLLREKGDPTNLFTIIDKRIEFYDNIGNINYRDVFKWTKNLIEGYVGSSNLDIDIITPDWLKRLELQMKTDRKSNNTIGVHMRNIRTCYNEAITMGNASLEAYPFRRYKIPRETTRKRNLTALEIAKIARAEIREPLMAWARDMFMLSFYLMGINMVDLFKVKQVEDGRIFYIRSKGKKHYSIQVPPEAQEIIDRYPGKKYLLDTMDNYSDYRTATKRVNYKLKDIASSCGINKEVTTYYCRHSWATIGRTVGVSVDDLSMGLGHSTPGKAMTTIYLNEEEYSSVTDQANRKIIDHISGMVLSPADVVIIEDSRKKAKTPPSEQSL